MSQLIFPTADLPERFSEETNSLSPLADRMRPKNLDDIIGQEHLLSSGKLLRDLIEKDQLSSLVLWGPPGCGKTTIAHLIARTTKAHFFQFNASTSSIKEVKLIMEEAKIRHKLQHKKTIVFIDEIHRFNKAQQDAFLPFVEKGIITLIGATTENPSFEVNNALLSRSKVFVLKQLDQQAIQRILERALSTPLTSLPPDQKVPEDILAHIANYADGDARVALNTLELLLNYLASQHKTTATSQDLQEVLQHKSLRYDKNAEEHFNLISALHKCMRDSDVDASLYWLTRMIEAGEDPLYIARRVIRFASEDIGLADPQALIQAVAAFQAIHFVGLPEASLALAQAVAYMALAPKDNALYRAQQAIQTDVQNTLNEPVPMNLRNAPTKLMKELGYGKNYQYAHDFPNQKINQPRLPTSLAHRNYFTPVRKKA